MVDSINYHHNDIKTVDYVLPSFGLFLAHSVSLFGHIARYAPSRANEMTSKRTSKSDKANL